MASGSGERGRQGCERPISELEVRKQKVVRKRLDFVHVCVPLAETCDVIERRHGPPASDVLFCQLWRRGVKVRGKNMMFIFCQGLVLPYLLLRDTELHFL